MFEILPLVLISIVLFVGDKNNMDIPISVIPIHRSTSNDCAGVGFNVPSTLASLTHLLIDSRKLISCNSDVRLTGQSFTVFYNNLSTYCRSN